MVEKDERRNYKRLKKEVKIEISCYDGETDESKIFTAPVSKNISAGGTLVNFNKPFELGSFVVVRFELPERRYIMVLARVVRVEVIEDGISYDIGLAFANPRKSDVADINEYVTSELNEE